MVDNTSILYVENDILYDTSNTTVLSNTNDLVNVFQPDTQSNVIFVTKEQLESIGFCLENDVTQNYTPAVEKKVILNTKCIVKKPVIQNTKSRSVLKKQYQNFDNPAQENVVKYIPVHIPQYEVPISNIIKVQQNKVLKQLPVTIVKKSETIEPTPVIIPEVPNKIVYRILHPEELRLTERKNKTITSSLEVESKQQPKGRPFKTRDYLVQESLIEKRIVEKKSVGIEKRTEYKEEDIKDKIDDGVRLKAVRTRFGRVTKPPQHLKKELSRETGNMNHDIIEPPKKQIRLSLPFDNKKLNNSSHQQNPETQPQIINPELNNLPKESHAITPSIETKKIETKPAPTKRRISSTKYKCKTCNKYYLGKVRMRKHLQNNPDHIVPKKYEPYNKLWLDLIERIRNCQRAEQVATFLGELAYILQKVKIIVPKALHPVLKKDEYNFGIVDSKISTVLGIPEGKYTLDINILEDDSLVLNNTDKNNSVTKISNESHVRMMDATNSELIHQNVLNEKNINDCNNSSVLKTNILENLNHISECNGSTEINILNPSSSSELLQNIISNNDSIHIDNTTQSNILNMETLNHNLKCNRSTEISMINSDSSSDLLQNIIRSDESIHINNDNTESNILSIETLSNNINKCDDFPEVSLLNSDSTDSNLIQDIIKNGALDSIKSTEININPNSNNNLISNMITSNPVILNSENSNLIQNIIRNDNLNHINDNSVPNILNTQKDLIQKLNRSKTIMDPSILDVHTATESILDCNDRNSNSSDNAVQTSLLNLLDTGQVNFDTTDSSHTCDVDQLVHERLKSLTGELSTSNSNQNITLDLSMDMFPYTS